MGILDYGLYEIRCRFHGPDGKDRANPSVGYWHVPNGRRDPSKITQWTLEEPGAFENHHFQWLFVPAGEPDHYYIVNRRSGLCLRVSSADGSQELRQDHYAPERDLEFRFVLEPVHEDLSGYKLTCFASGNPLVVEKGDVNNGARILAYPDVLITDRVNFGHTEFEVTEVKSEILRPAERNDDDQQSMIAREVPALRSLDQYLPSSFPDNYHTRVIEHETVAFFMINDPGLAPYRQIEVSPYYTLRHYQRWDKLLDRQFDGRTRRETTETTVVGMTQLDASSFKSTFKFSLETTAQAGYKAGGFSGSLKLTAKIERTVDETRERNTERSESRTRTEKVNYPDLGSPYRIVTWAPVDVYELCRTDTSHPISAWTVTREGEDVTDFFADAPVHAPQT